jgi:hypothetical protein
MTTSSANGNRRIATAILAALVVFLAAFPVLLGLQTLYHAADQSDVSARTRRPVAQQEAGYAWIDRDKGVLRIPIERAMDLVVQEAGRKNARE